MKEIKNKEAKVASKVENTSVAAQAEVANIEPKAKKDKKDKKLRGRYTFSQEGEEGQGSGDQGS